MSTIESIPVENLGEDYDGDEQRLLLSGFEAIELSTAALAKLRKHNLPIATELLAEEESEHQPAPEEKLAEVIPLDRYRKTQPPPAEEPLLGVEPLDSHELLELPTERSADELTEEPVQELVPDAQTLEPEPLTEIEEKVLGSPEALDLMDRGFANVEEIKSLAGVLEVSAYSLAKYLNQTGTEIEGIDDYTTVPEATGEKPPEINLSTTEALQLFLNDAAKFKLLTAEDEVMLAKRVERGDRSAKELMINSNLRLVVSIAKRYQGHGVSLIDLIQDGAIGLNRAVEKFDWRMGNKFSTYSTWWIRQACQRSIANNSKNIRIPVHVVERQQKLRKAAAQYLVRERREATPEELAAMTRIRFDHVKEALGTVNTVSMQTPIGGDSDGELGDLLSDPDDVPIGEEVAESLDIRSVIDFIFTSRKLTDEEKVILSLRFGVYSPELENFPIDGRYGSYQAIFEDAKAREKRHSDRQFPLEVIGKVLGITRERVSAMEDNALETISETYPELRSYIE